MVLSLQIAGTEGFTLSPNRPIGAWDTKDESFAILRHLVTMLQAGCRYVMKVSISVHLQHSCSTLPLAWLEFFKHSLDRFASLMPLHPVAG